MKKTLIGATLNEIDAMRVVLPGIEKSVKDKVDQIIIVDGGSTDGTVEFCKEKGFFVLNQKGRGYGAAFKQALEHAEGEIIIEITPDGSVLLDKIPEVAKKIEEGYDLVIVSRYMKPAKSYDDTLITAMGNHAFTWMANLLFKSSYTDTLVGFRAYKKSTYEKLKKDLDSDGLSWPLQNAIVFSRKGYKVGEIPGDEPKRIGGKRKMTIVGTGFEILFLILREYSRMKKEKRKK